MNNKSLLSNSIYNVIYKLLNVLFPLASASYVSRVLMAEGVGKFASAQNVVSYFLLIAALGIPSYGTREIAKMHNDKYAVNQLFSELFYLNLMSTLLCCFAYYIFIFKSGYFDDELYLYATLGISVIFNIINIDWYYQGTEEFKYIATRSFVIKFIMLILLFIFVHSKNDYVIYAIIYVLATAGNYFLNIIYLKKKEVKLVFTGIKLKKHIKPILILLCTTLAIELYTLLDTTMITYYCESQNVAYYTNSIKIVRIIITLISAIGGVLLPRLSYYYSEGRIDDCNQVINKVFYVMLFLFLPCGVGIILVADMIQTFLFGVSFAAAASTLKIAALLIYALGFSNLFGTQVLLTFNSEKKLFLCTVVGAVSNICMNTFLIPRFQQNGAAIASVISETLVTVLSFYFASKYVHVKFEKKIIGYSCFSCVIMAFIIILIQTLFKNSYLLMFIEIIVGMLVYLLSSIVLKNPIINILGNIINKKRKRDICTII